MAEESAMEQRLFKLLKEKHLSLAVAESCTGGLLAGKIIDVPGVSEVFRAGFVTYTEKAKHDILGVSEETLERETAVSAKTAQEMVIGAAEKGEAQVAIATTGLAGPGGGTDQKPVGLVYIACFVLGTITVQEYHFQGDRSTIREKTVRAALKQAIECILAM